MTKKPIVATQKRLIRRRDLALNYPILVLFLSTFFGTYLLLLYLLMTQMANYLLKEIENLLEKLEASHENIYQHSILSNLTSKDTSFLSEMNSLSKSMLQGILHLDSLMDLVDEQLIRLLCRAFYGEAAKVEELEGTVNGHPSNPDFLQGCAEKTRIFSALLIVYVSDQLIKRFKKRYELDWVEIFEDQKNKFDEKAKDLLSESHKGNRRKTKTLLTEGYFAEIANKNSKATTLLEIADRANAHKFLALPCVQRFIDHVWVNGMNSVKKVEVGGPIRDATENRERAVIPQGVTEPLIAAERMEATALSNTTTTSTFETVLERAPFYKRPRNIFVVHTLFYLLYMVLYGLFLQHMYSLGRNFENSEINWKLIGWAFGLLLEWLILWYEFFFYLNFIFTSLRSLLILTISSFFGTIIFTIENMFKTFFKFAPVIIVFWLVYSTVQLSLTDVTSDKNFVWAMFIHGAFELVQDTQDETKNGSIQSVGNVECPNETQSVLGKQCFLRRGMAPVVLFFYIMGASVLVINILTTLINQQYDDAQAKASHHWNSRKLRRTMLYQKSHLPPPFNIFVDFGAYLIGLCSGEGINKLRRLKEKNSDQHCYSVKVQTPPATSSSNIESGNGNQNDNIPLVDAEEDSSTDRNSLLDTKVNVEGFDYVKETGSHGN